MNRLIFTMIIVLGSISGLNAQSAKFEQKGGAAGMQLFTTYVQVSVDLSSKGIIQKVDSGSWMSGQMTAKMLGDESPLLKVEDMLNNAQGINEIFASMSYYDFKLFDVSIVPLDDGGVRQYLTFKYERY